MLKSTITVITSTTNTVLGADPSIDAPTRNRILAAIRNALNDKADTPTARPLVKRSELKRLTGLTGVSIDRYARKGFLVRVHLGGSSRATGFTPESVDAFLAGRAATGTEG